MLNEHLTVPEGCDAHQLRTGGHPRELFARLSELVVHLVTPTYALFPEIAHQMTKGRVAAADDFEADLNDVDIPPGTTLMATQAYFFLVAACLLTAEHPATCLRDCAAVGTQWTGIHI